MKPEYITNDFLEDFINAALREDVGDGDHSSLAAIPAGMRQRARLLIKEDGILAGVEVARAIFAHMDASIKPDVLIQDGNRVKKGDVAFTVEGPARTLLTGERLVLNCMQRMSGIATVTRTYADLLQGTGTVLLDTRKTTPNFRRLEKWAVAIGGGRNHRMGLFDMIMLKDNHIDMAGGIRKALENTRAYLQRENRNLRIEIETRSLAEVLEVLEVGGVDIIMLDNMRLDEMAEAVKLIGGRYKTEASGGITHESIRKIAECGVDFISSGALTHRIYSLDLSLKAY